MADGATTTDIESLRAAAAADRRRNVLWAVAASDVLKTNEAVSKALAELERAEFAADRANRYYSKLMAAESAQQVAPLDSALLPSSDLLAELMEPGARASAVYPMVLAALKRAEEAAPMSPQVVAARWALRKLIRAKAAYYSSERRTLALGEDLEKVRASAAKALAAVA